MPARIDADVTYPLYQDFPISLFKLYRGVFVFAYAHVFCYIELNHFCRFVNV